MFIPIGHDQSGVRRWPWVTFTIMGLCVLAFALTAPAVNEAERRVASAFIEVAEYFVANTDLLLDPELEQEILGFIPNTQDQREAFKEAMSAMQVPFGGEGEGEVAQLPRAERQAHLDELSRRYFEAVKDNPYFNWGLVPADQTLHGWLTSMFMHAGWLHLISNLLFLYLSGPYIEDRWGRVMFAVFYLAGGLVAAGIYVLRYPDLEDPLIGASGAIAAVMGAFLVRFWSTKIKLLMFFLLTPRVVDLPAWLMLPLWLLREIFFEQAVQMGAQTGTAHLAHIGGFLFGVGVALGIARAGIESRWVDASLERKALQYEDPKLEEALLARAQGEDDRALALLHEILEEEPGNLDAAVSLWSTERTRDNAAAVVPLLIKALQVGLRSGDTAQVEGHWQDILDDLPRGSLDPAVGLRIAEGIKGSAEPEIVQRTIEAAAEGVGDSTPSGVVLRLTCCVRLFGTQFDPRTLVAGESAMDAFRRFLDEVLETSEAAGLPDPDGARGNPFRRFSSLAEYQSTVLQVG